MSNNTNPFDNLIRMMEAFHNAGPNNGQGFDIPTILDGPDVHHGDRGQTPRQRILRRQAVTMADDNSHPIPSTSQAMPTNPFFQMPQMPQHSLPPHHTPNLHNQTQPQQLPWDNVSVFDQGSDGHGFGRMVGGLIGSMLGSVLMGGLTSMPDFPEMESDGTHSASSSSSHSMSSYSSSSTIIGEDGVPVTTITTKKTVDGETTTETKVLRGGREVESMLVNPLRLRDTTRSDEEDFILPYGTVRVNPETIVQQTVDADESTPSQPIAQPNNPQGNNQGGVKSFFGKIFG